MAEAYAAVQEGIEVAASPNALLAYLPVFPSDVADSVINITQSSPSDQHENFVRHVEDAEASFSKEHFPIDIDSATKERLGLSWRT